MASVINSNIASLNTQRNLSASQGALNTSIQRLSSGLRINTSKDDAAGLAISTRMDTQIRGANQAIRNSNDAISLTQTADGALASVADNLQRIRELAVQSSNSTNTTVDRAALNSEVAQLQAELQRTATQASFNGVKMLDGTFSNQSFQVGANAGEAINIASITNVQTSVMGLAYSTTSAVGALPPTVPPTTGTSTAAISAGGITINGIDIGAVPAVTGAASSAAASLQFGINVSQAINQLTAQTGVTATANATTGAITMTSVSATAANSVITIAGTGVAAAGLAAAATTAATTTTATTAVGSMDVTTMANAELTIATMDRALADVNTARANMGAIQNRFNAVISNLQTTAENITSAKSRIMDTDFAAETAKLSRGQILQQAGTAMLAQANALPNNVLSLLKG
jgi:flagellin